MMRPAVGDRRAEGGLPMRKVSIVTTAVLVGVLVAGLGSAVAATGIAQEETIVLGEHTVKGRFIDLAGGPDDFKPGDRYLFRSRLSDDGGTAGSLAVECVVHFAGRDQCSQVYEVAGRGTIVVEGLVPADQLFVGGTWTLAVIGGSGEFEGVGGSVGVVIVNDEGDTQHTLHLVP
jgi:hypothetical protein